MTLLLARVPLARLARTRRAWLPIAGWTLLAIATAVVARARGGGTGADHVMRGAFGVLVVPLLTYGIVSAVLGGAGMRAAIRGVVTLGAAPRRAALASLLVAAGASAIVCGLLAAIVCGLAHGAQDPPLTRDLPTSMWIGALGGAAYASYYCAASAIGKGLVRGAFLALDWIVGASAGVGAVLTPRGHVMSLLGGHHVAEISQRGSSVLLVVLALAYAALTLQLTRKA